MSALLLISVTGVAYARSRLGLFRTIGLLLIARLNQAQEDGHCIQCGYNLFGLTEPRCPECGTPFPSRQEARSADADMAGRTKV
jgi:ribosomal protein L37E